MRHYLTIGIGGLAWGLAAYGVLSLNRLPPLYVHALCGPWGCLPSLWSLLAMHGFWMLVFVPAGAGMVRSFGPSRLRKVGGGMAAIGAGFTLLILGHAAISWLVEAAPGDRLYAVPRALMALAMQVDVPAIPALVVGLACWAVGRRRETLANRAEPPDERRDDDESAQGPEATAEPVEVGPSSSL